MKTSSKTALIACAAIAGAFTAGFMTGPATAEPQQAEPFKFNFDYRVAETASLPDAEKLLARLERDVRSYCGFNRKMALDERATVEVCIANTMKDTVGKFGNATVAQAFQSRADG
jgi:UrcA family protein